MNKWVKMSKEDKDYGRLCISQVESYASIGSQDIYTDEYYIDTLPEGFILEDYQTQSRIYLDEYEEQEKLRKEWFEKRKEKDRFIAKLIGEPYISKRKRVDWIAQIAEDYCYYESDQIFNNRWMRRN